jgi:hypothetical protein
MRAALAGDIDGSLVALCYWFIKRLLFKCNILVDRNACAGDDVRPDNRRHAKHPSPARVDGPIA